MTEGFLVDTAIRMVVIFSVLVITMGLLLYIEKTRIKRLDILSK